MVLLIIQLAIVLKYQVGWEWTLLLNIVSVYRDTMPHSNQSQDETSQLGFT